MAEEEAPGEERPVRAVLMIVRTIPGAASIDEAAAGLWLCGVVVPPPLALFSSSNGETRGTGLCSCCAAPRSRVPGKLILKKVLLGIALQIWKIILVDIYRKDWGS